MRELLKLAFISGFLFLGIAGFTIRQSGLEWVKYGGKLPANVVYGGQENGQKLAVCRCDYNGALHSGKVVAGKCNIGWGGKEITSSNFEVLVNNNVETSWTTVTGNSMVPNAVIAGVENKGTYANNSFNYYVGKATYGNGVHPGKVFWNGTKFICNIGYGGKEITIADQFKVLVSGTSVPTQSSVPAQGSTTAQGTASSTTGCPSAIGHWNISGGYMSLKEDGQMTAFKGAKFGTWKCAENQVKLIYDSGEKFLLTMNADGTMTGQNGGAQFVVKPMTKQEKDAMKMVDQVDDALNKIFKKKN